MITLTVNGKQRQLNAPTTLSAYLAALEITATSIAVAHNGTVLRPEEFATTTLSHGDQIEIVRAVGGG